MRRTLTVIMAALVVVGTLGAGTALGAVPSTATVDANNAQSDATNESNESIAPGERLSGVVGVQEAELDGEVESRSFGLAVARAASNESKAALIAAKVNETERELGNLSEQREQLREARQNGSMSQGQFAARMAELSARSQNIKRTANDTANASQGLPADLLESKGVNATAIQTLRTQANNMTGQEVSEIARSIAGNAGNQARGGDRGGDQRPSDGNQTEPRDRGQNRGGQSDAETTDETETNEETTTTATEETETTDTESTDSTTDSGGSAGSSGSGNASDP
jgi:hypothetical protein